MIVLRSFSTAVSHAPPKKIFGTHGRYAGAVYTAASKAGLLEKVESELLAVGSILKKSSTLEAFFANPTIPRGEKTTKVNHLLSDSTKFSYITQNLFLTLCANGKAGEAGKVLSAFNELMAASRGSVKVTIISAQPLTAKQLAAVQKGITSMLGEKKVIDLNVAVDANILGGLQVMVDDLFLDLSVASRVNSLSGAIEAAH
mmetsp:Transcript_11030/g.16599  ORF Transcript_11030/g.16599 Transcript_11030/m.16599 type:complete len:201 (+) Transcript_11030:123-725(+)